MYTKFILRVSLHRHPENAYSRRAAPNSRPRVPPSGARDRRRDQPKLSSESLLRGVLLCSTLLKKYAEKSFKTQKRSHAKSTLFLVTVAVLFLTMSAVVSLFSFVYLFVVVYFVAFYRGSSRVGAVEAAAAAESVAVDGSGVGGGEATAAEEVACRD